MDTPESSLDLLVLKATPGELATNAAILQKAIKSKLEGYKSENYTSDNVAEAKKDKAELNTVAKKLTERRIALERQFMAPLDEFKQIITAICADIQSASRAIDVIVKSVEEREKSSKFELISDYWRSRDFGLVLLARIFDERWLNKTVSMKQVKDAIDARISTIESDLATLDRVGEPDAKAFYLDTLDLKKALDKADQIKAARIRLQAEEKARSVVVEPVEEDPVVEVGEPNVEEVQEQEPQEEPEPQEEVAPAPENHIYERTFRCWGTKDQIIGLGTYMVKNGIEFAKIIY